MSVQAAVNLALYMAILPAVATFVLSRYAAAAKDLLLAKGSIVLSVLGAVVLALSATPAVMIIGKSNNDGRLPRLSITTDPVFV